MPRPLFALLVMIVVSAPAFAAPAEEYMRAQALINWTQVIPQEKITQENMPRSFMARVKKAGKLQSLGLPVRIGDLVRMDQQGPYIWTVTKDEQTIKVNTYDIPAASYPRFQ